MVASRPSFYQSAQLVIDSEIAAVQKLKTAIDDHFVQACQTLLQCRGRIIVTGMGKSGHIGNKIAATLASTGSPAFFVHPGEASHGDLGMITSEDVLVAISSSGNTEEILLILPLIKKRSIPLIALTGNPQSALAEAANIHLDVSVDREACPLNLAPTASTTAALVMGDAIAIALLQARGFSKEDFALTHPAGYLGKRLLLKINDLMHKGNAIPKVQADASLKQALLEMTQKSLGLTAIVDEHNKLQGVFTDGDLRRVLEKDCSLQKTTIGSLMTTQCKTVEPDSLAIEALELMEAYQIFSLLIVDKQNQLVGALNMHDLFRAGIVK